MQPTTRVRDMSRVKLPPNARWSNELVTCPYCGVVSPRAEAWVCGRWIKMLPYPCDCAGYRKNLARVEQRERERRERAEPRLDVPERFERAEVDASSYAETIKTGLGLYLWGGNGNGKTTTAWGVAGILSAEGWSVEVTTLGKIGSSVSDTYSTADTQDALFRKLSRCDLLVLDDLGKEKPSETSGALLYRIVNERYEAQRQMLITSNYSRGKLAARLAEGCAPSTAQAIASRLSEMTAAIEFTGTDRRIA